MANRSYEDRSSRRNRNRDQSLHNPESWRSFEGRNEGRRDEEYGERQLYGEELDEGRVSFGGRGRYENQRFYEDRDRDMDQNRFGGGMRGEQSWAQGPSQLGQDQTWHGQGGQRGMGYGSYPSKEAWLGGQTYGQGWQSQGLSGSQFGQGNVAGTHGYGQGSLHSGYGQQGFGQGYGQQGFGQGQQGYGQGGYGQYGNQYGGQSFGGQGGYGQSNYAGASLGQSHLGQGYGQSSVGQGFGQSFGQSSFGQGAFGQGRTGGFDQSRMRGRGPKGYTRSDERIKEDVCDCLSDGSIDASDVEVTVRNGEVTLTGSVSDRATKWQIEEQIDRVSGVKDVHNQLTVQRGGNISSSESMRASGDNGKADDKRTKATPGTH